VLVVLVQQRRPPAAGSVLQGGRAGVGGVKREPVVDTLAGHAQHAGDVGGGAAVIKLQDGQGPAEEPGIACLGELAAQALALPRGQVELAHGIVLHR